MIIGICGKSCSGKSTLANQLIKHYDDNTTYLDIDKIGHKVLMIREVKEELVNNFGPSVIDGEDVDRKKLGQIVFASRKEMGKLSDITWKYMQIEIDKLIDISSDRVVILDWILLPNTKYFNMCDFKILLDIPYDIRKKRAIKRDNISDSAFDLREKASIDFNPDDFNYVLKNNEEKSYKRLVKLL